MITALTILIAFVVALLVIIKRVEAPKFLSYIHVAFLFLIILDLTLDLNISWSFKGAYTDRIIAALWFETGIILFGCYFRQKNKRLLRVYFAFYFTTPILFILMYFIPRTHFFAAMLGLGILLDGDIKRYPTVSDFQLQESYSGVLGSSCPMLDIIESKGVFEKKNSRVLYRPCSPIKTIKTKLIDNNKLAISIMTDDTSKVYADTVITLGKYQTPKNF